MLGNLKTAASKFVLDVGGSNSVTIAVGMGRSGTTWVGNIINYDGSYRVLFEPFFPKNVPEARDLGYLKYIHPACDQEKLVASAKNILAGHVRPNSWVDRENKRFFYRKRLIKDIRCNFMLGWLKRLGHNPPIVLVVRHPLQTILSWKKLGWGYETEGGRSDFDVITSQENMLKDIPLINEVKGIIDPDDFFETLVYQWCVYQWCVYQWCVYQWCVYQLVPLMQLAKNEFHIVFYESLVLNPNREISALFAYLGKTFDPDNTTKISGIPSSTNFNNRNISKDKMNLLNGWRNEFSSRLVNRANYILAAFGMGAVYDSNGYPTEIEFGKLFS